MTDRILLLLAVYRSRTAIAWFCRKRLLLPRTLLPESLSTAVRDHTWTTRPCPPCSLEDPRMYVNAHNRHLVQVVAILPMRPLLHPNYNDKLYAVQSPARGTALTITVPPPRTSPLSHMNAGTHWRPYLDRLTTLMLRRPPALRSGVSRGPRHLQSRALGIY